MSPVQTSPTASNNFSSSSASSSVKSTDCEGTQVYKYDTDVLSERDIASPIHPVMGSRRSTRAMSGEEVEEDVLRSIFEAARWSPSYYNSQPWRFVYAKRGDAYWEQYVGAINERNRAWAQDASVLIVLLSRKSTMKPTGLVPSPMYSFDTGAAWMSLALEATARGLVVHAIYGIDFAKTAQAIGFVNDEESDYFIQCMIVIGHRAARADGKPELCTPRNPIEHFVSAGRFHPKWSNVCL